ncbi:nuclear transcription factor Y subunit beta [Drosophila subobscura]|uniref:nuclear transcription factor Y subunit beta n=1 Tax=Drosophila subobscura TaxID=7241 RepID=UPI00155ACAF9|nr:nuclear transcription factor Y subunit beta [Drosophila subobscura]
MSSLSLTIALCLACLAAADVSHLPSSYLPPPKPEHAVSMSIEQQELRELPEQVEFMRENEQGVMEAMPSSLLTPPAPLETEQMDAMLSSRYLPPAPQMEQRSEPEMMMQQQQQQPQMEMEPEQPQIAMRYLPPPAATSEEQQDQQLTYQQYQEQMQMPQEEEQMPYYMDVQQPMAPTDVEAEPVPAHELRSDGYHYKQAEEQLRLRH